MTGCYLRQHPEPLDWVVAGLIGAVIDINRSNLYLAPAFNPPDILKKRYAKGPMAKKNRYALSNQSVINNESV